MQDVERTFNNQHRRGDFMTTAHTPSSSHNQSGAERPPGNGMEALETQRGGSPEGHAEIGKPPSAPDHTPHSVQDDFAALRAEAAWRIPHVRDELNAAIDRIEEQLEALRAAAQGFIDTMAIRYSDVEGREVPSGFSSESRQAAIRLYDVLYPANVLADSYPPPEDVERAAELARERGWKDIGGQGVVEDPAKERNDG